MTAGGLVRVVSIRSKNPNGFGGCIFTGKPIDSNGYVTDAAAYVVVKASSAVIGTLDVQIGQWWQVAGTETQRTREINGYLLSERQVEASSARLARPSGEHLVRYLADNSSFIGIGHVKARKLWHEFGEKLYLILDEGNVSALTLVIPRHTAESLLSAWAGQGDSRTLQWLQAEGFDLRLGRKVQEYFGRETEAKLKDDPYRLLSFCCSWRDVDRLAQKHFGILPDDHRRLQGAIEEALYRVFADGHTSALSSTVLDRLEAILGPRRGAMPWKDLAVAALNQGLTNGSYIVGQHGLQSLGAHVMERQVASAIAQRVSSPAQPLLPDAEVERLVTVYEQAEDVLLNDEQREAIRLGVRNSLAVITGGAGVGKTTVLKALYSVFASSGVEVVQLALAGRAARRMQDATHRPATTIASFLKGQQPLPERCVVVIDEASMVDIITMSRLCQLLRADVRLVLVGDPAQLMPVGPGLVLHALARVRQVASVELRTVKRYGGLIADAAGSIRRGAWPSLTDDATAPIAFFDESGGASQVSTVLKLYQASPKDTQILCARRSGSDGMHALNLACQAATGAHRPSMLVWSGEHDTFVNAGFRVGDPILCLRNLWDLGLQNGSLGVLAELVAQPARGDPEPGFGSVLGWIDWDDGERRPVFANMLDDLALGYAITVHKAQGSQWKRVIVSLTGRRLLDRTLVYTALTRAQQQVLLVGDREAVRAAVVAEPRAHSREIALDILLRELLTTSSDEHAIKAAPSSN